MKIEDLIGNYTYRSFLDRPAPVDDFNKIKFAEAELFLHLNDDGTVTGHLAFPAEPAAAEKRFMDISGTVSAWAPLKLHFTGKGRPNTDIADYEYEYDCAATHTWDSSAPPQRVVLTGTVRRNKDHGSAKGGATASFAAVKRDFVEPRDVPGVALIPEAITMLASRSHRLRHTVWHTLRGDWYGPKMTDADRSYLRTLEWGLDDPPFTRERRLDLTNGAGEDFLFMHRRMIAMLGDVYRANGKQPPSGWKSLPGPVSPQFAYQSLPDPNTAGQFVFRYDAAQSGFLVPPATDDLIAAFGEGNRFLKSNRFFTVIMRNIERWLQNPRILAQLTLAAYGNLLEMTIHNWMHMRWTCLPRDPVTGAPGSRGDYEVDERWDAPRYDYLSDFHSSHVNPIFWRLHGWVDDRIEDWFSAQEAVRPGVVQRKTLKGLPWFAKGAWVVKDNPFDWPETHSGHGDHGHSHGHGGGEDQDIATMLKVMDRLREVAARPDANAKARAGSLTGLAQRVQAFDFDELPLE